MAKTSRPSAANCWKPSTRMPTTQRAIQQFNLLPDQEPTEEQLDQVEQQAMQAALKPFHNPKPAKSDP